MKLKNSVALVVTMRTGSSRLPGKMTVPIADGKCSIDFFKTLFDRIEAQHGDLVKPIIAIPECEGESFVNEFKKRKIKIFKGSETDVLHRVVNAAKSMHCAYIMDITGDCPFVAKALIDTMLTIALPLIACGEKIYYSNVFPERHCPDGQDIQLYSTAFAEFVLTKCEYLKEHSGWNVFGYAMADETVVFRNIQKPIIGEERSEADIRMTLDTEADVMTLRKMHKIFEIFDGLQTIDTYQKFISYFVDMEADWWPNKNIRAKEIGE